MNAKENTNIKNQPSCGIIIPISEINGYSTDHWAEVLSIIKDAIISAGFDPCLVSDSDNVTIIHKTIVHNLYNNEIIVCDVSGKNPNVMFELGLRLAFDKPTIIVKDDQTDYSFDTSTIEHITYPMDLRFPKIISFKERLKNKLQATYKKAQEDPNYSTFLKSFGQYELTKLGKISLTSEEFILKSIEEIKSEMHKVLLRQNALQKNNDTKKITVPSEYAVSLVRDIVELFCKDRNIEPSSLSFTHLADNQELYNYLESTRKVREACGSIPVLKKILEDEFLIFDE